LIKEFTMRTHMLHRLFLASAIALPFTVFAGPVPIQDVPEAESNQQKTTTVMDELVVTGATEQGRNIRLEASERERSATRLPSIDEQTWLPSAAP
jgi:hypothetical protein